MHGNLYDNKILLLFKRTITVIKNIFLCCDLIKGPLKTLQNIMLTKLTFKYKLNENRPPKFGAQCSHCLRSAGV